MIYSIFENVILLILAIVFIYFFHLDSLVSVIVAPKYFFIYLLFCLRSKFPIFTRRFHILIFPFHFFCQLSINLKKFYYHSNNMSLGLLFDLTHNLQSIFCHRAIHSFLCHASYYSSNHPRISCHHYASKFQIPLFYHLTNTLQIENYRSKYTILFHFSFHLQIILCIYFHPSITKVLIHLARHFTNDLHIFRQYFDSIYRNHLLYCLSTLLRKYLHSRE